MSLSTLNILHILKYIYISIKFFKATYECHLQIKYQLILECWSSSICLRRNVGRPLHLLPQTEEKGEVLFQNMIWWNMLTLNVSHGIICLIWFCKNNSIFKLLEAVTHFVMCQCYDELMEKLNLTAILYFNKLENASGWHWYFLWTWHPYGSSYSCLVSYSYPKDSCSCLVWWYVFDKCTYNLFYF